MHAFPLSRLCALAVLALATLLPTAAHGQESEADGHPMRRDSTSARVFVAPDTASITAPLLSADSSSVAAAQMVPTRAELAQLFAAPRAHVPVDSMPPSRRTRKAPSFAALYAAGVGGGVAGGLAGAGFGAFLNQETSSEAVTISTVALTYSGAAIGVPVGVHLANGRRGQPWAGILTSIAGDLLINRVTDGLPPRRGTNDYAINGTTEHAIAVITRAVKIAAVVAVERASERW